MIFLSRMLGPFLISVPSGVLCLLIRAEVPDPAWFVICGLPVWCYGVGYIDRGWTEYLRSIGEL